jgi:hypothetical protein
VFAGTFDAPAAQTVVVGDGVEAWDVLDALAELVAKSMVDAEETVEGTTRYQMTETLRQYARERVDEHRDTDRWRRRHGEYFATWAEEAGPGLEGPDELAWRTRESAELDNLRAAVTWALDRDNPDDLALALRIIGALAAELIMNPTAGVGAWAEEALPHVGITSSQLRYAVTAAAANHQNNLGNYEQAQEVALAAIGDGVPLGAPAPGLAHIALGTSAVMLGDLTRALALQVDATRMLDRDFPASAHVAYAHANASMIASLSDAAIARVEAVIALRQARAIANPSTLATALLAHGWARSVDGPAAALVALDESIALCRQGANPVIFGIALNLATSARVRTGDLAHAVRDLREGVERTHQTGSRALFFFSVWNGIEVLTALDRYEEAAVFDGIVSTGFSTEWRAATAWTRQRAVIAEARAAYGSERYDAAFQAGAAMTYDQAVELTHRVLDDLVNKTNDTSET